MLTFSNTLHVKSNYRLAFVASSPQSQSMPVVFIPLWHDSERKEAIVYVSEVLTFHHEIVKQAFKLSIARCQNRED